MISSLLHLGDYFELAAWAHVEIFLGGGASPKDDRPPHKDKKAPTYIEKSPQGEKAAK